MQGRLRAVALISSQEEWRFDLPEAPGAHGQPRAPPQTGAHGQPRATPQTGPSAPGAQAREPPQSDQAAPKNLKRAAACDPVQLEVVSDNDDFMPPNKQHATRHVSSSISGDMLRRSLAKGHAGASKSSKYGDKHARPPVARCTPSVFTQFLEHLTMAQRMKIIDLGFGGLLQFSAGGIPNIDILVYLMNKLNPDSMILQVGNEGGLQINDLAVQKVLGIPNGDRDPPSSTEEENTRALLEFKKLVHVEKYEDVKWKHLLDLMRKCALDNEVAIRIFFVVAFNKLLFPGSDNNIRGQDAFMTKNLSRFGDINWCKVVVDDLRHAAITWRSEKKSIPGCAIFLIIFYLDSLQSDRSIDHIHTPRAKFFHKYVLEYIIQEDKRKDKAGKETYGMLPVRNIAHTCYQSSEPAPNKVTGVSYATSPPMNTSNESGLPPQISSKNEASSWMKLFDAKASQAIKLVQTGSKMLLDAHIEFGYTMRPVLEKIHVEKTTKDHDCCAPSLTNNCPGQER